ncbi:MAG TPA: NAD(P)/FAD-dependent oxidoreductase [Chloroflexota bacterium]
MNGTNAGGHGAGGAPPVVIIGAGIAGLAAAITLHKAGRTVCLLEASDGVGGRVRSDRTAEGFVLDRGFQVLFTAYPALGGLVDRRALRLRAFDSGALIAGSAPMQVVIDPFAHPTRLPQLLTNSPFSRADMLRLLRLKLELMGPASRRLAHAAERSTAEELGHIGFSRSALDRFITPFFGGVLLDRDLGTRAPWFLFLVKMLSEGRTVVPGDGMGALATQLAAHLPAGVIHLDTPAQEILRDTEGRAIAVQAKKERFPATDIILATDPWSARSLCPALPDLAPLGCTTTYFSSAEPLYRERLIVLNPDKAGFLNLVAQLTNVAPSYAPAGQHLLSCTSLVAQHLNDATVERRSLAELRQWFGNKVDKLRCLGIYRIGHAQFSQPPNWRADRPDPRTSTNGLYLAGEYLQSSSIQGALRSGVDAARAVIAPRTP